MKRTKNIKTQLTTKQSNKKIDSMIEQMENWASDPTIDSPRVKEIREILRHGANLVLSGRIKSEGDYEKLNNCAKKLSNPSFGFALNEQQASVEDENVESGFLNLIPHFPEDFKKLLKHILSTAIALLDSNDIAEPSDLGIVCAHIQCVADSSQNGELFKHGWSGIHVNQELCEQLQKTCPKEWQVAWNIVLCEREGLAVD